MKSPFSIQRLKPTRLLGNLKVGKYVTDHISTFSSALKRHITANIFRPHHLSEHKYPLLLMNDGQDAESVQLMHSAERLWQRSMIEPVIIAAVHAGDRLHEYGIAGSPDYANRGAGADRYTKFLMEEFIPLLKSKYPIQSKDNSIAGFSLCGLSAFDIAWNNSEFFGKVGAFSGSFWWRSVDTTTEEFDEKQHRIMHQIIRESEFKSGLRFWFQTGTKDEPFDRNSNGVIDSIDDTLDLISELTKKGYRPYYDIVYHEVKDGEHNHRTWAQALPQFLKWAFGN